MAVISDDRPIPGADLEGLFRAPPPTGPLMDDETPPSSSTASPSTSSSSTTARLAGGPYGSASLRPETPADTRTGTSATSGSPRGDARAAGKALLALVGALVLVVDAVLVRTAQRRLRRPTRAQMTALSTPAGRLAYRHGAAAVLGEDVGDIIDMTGAVAEYLLDGPVTTAGPEVRYADDDYDDEDLDGPAPDPLRAYAPPPPPPEPPAPANVPHVTYLT